MEYNFSNKLANLKPSAIREIFKSLTDPEIIAFAAGNPNPLSFPADEFKRIAADILADDAIAALQYGITEGYAPLRRLVAERNREKFGIGGDGDDTIIVSGGQQGIELACKAFCNEGDVVLCEDPSFIGALNSFRSCGATPIGVPLGENGIDPDALDEAAERTGAKLLYIIPNFQNPAGSCTPLETRRRIYEVAKRRGLIILEDDPYGELRFSGEAIPSIKSLDTEGIVIYCSSFSKLLSSGLRVGHVTAPKRIIEKMTVAKQSEDVHTNCLAQMLVYRYITECDFEAHIESIRALYAKKSAIMLDALDREMPAGVTFTRPEGGLFVWCTLPDGVDLGELVSRALARKVAVVPGTAFMPDNGLPARSFRMTYATPTDEQIVRGVGILGEIIRELMA